MAYWMRPICKISKWKDQVTHSKLSSNSFYHKTKKKLLSRHTTPTRSTRPSIARRWQSQYDTFNLNVRCTCIHQMPEGTSNSSARISLVDFASTVRFCQLLFHQYLCVRVCVCVNHNSGENGIHIDSSLQISSCTFKLDLKLGFRWHLIKSFTINGRPIACFTIND